jgi:hypothetical protein
LLEIRIVIQLRTTVPLALGLWLVDALRKEERNKRDPAAKLADIIEPILALAKTSEVILSALQVSCLASDCPFSVGAALAQYYIGCRIFLKASGRHSTLS